MIRTRPLIPAIPIPRPKPSKPPFFLDMKRQEWHSATGSLGYRQYESRSSAVMGSSEERHQQDLWNEQDPPPHFAPQ
jgi:hypothetical protein